VGVRVLVVDDQPDTVEVLTVMLDALGCDVRGATTGRDALRIARELCPELVLVDIGLPDMTGHALATALRGDAATATCTLIAITGRDRLQDIAHSRRAGFDDHFVKPVELKTIKALLARVRQDS
jgi:CheY-like chemotaxis protein